MAEVVQWAALVSGTLVRLANDVETMGRTAIGELRAAKKAGASSTMPHKTNPRDANMIQTAFQLNAMYAGQAVHLMDQVDVRAASKRAQSWVIVPEAMRGLSTSLERAVSMLRGLVVDKARMLANFEHSRGFVMSEAVMFVLAAKTGRDRAYSLVRTALQADDGVSTLVDILSADEDIRRHLTPQDIHRAGDPREYLGSAAALVDEVLEQARPWCGPNDPGVSEK